MGSSLLPGSFEVEEMAKTKPLPVFRILIVLVTLIGLFFPAQKANANADILFNGDFELGTLHRYGNQITGWQQDGWKIGRSKFTWDYIFSHSGKRSAKITNLYRNEARWVQTIPVRPHSIYRLSGWIRTLGIPYGTVEGASLAIMGTELHTKPILGNHDWTYVYLDFITTDEPYVQVAASLGGEDGRVTGTAWFDDIHFDLINSAPCYSLSLKMDPPLVGKSIEAYPPPNCNNGSQYAYGTHVSLHALPLEGSGYRFDHWQNEHSRNENPLMITITADNELTANFVAGKRTSPEWKILVLVYPEVDFTFYDLSGKHHFVSKMTSSEVDRAVTAATQFVNKDIPELTSGALWPSLTVRLPDHPITSLQKFCGYYPSLADTKADQDVAYDSVIVIWDDTGIDDIGTELNITDCGGLTYPNGTSQTYTTIPFESVSVFQENVFKHEWGHAILAYFAAAGVSPDPVVDNHINTTTNQYVNCLTGAPFLMENEVFADTLPNSLYNNFSGFTHDYYSGLTARADDPTKCLGISAQVWAYGGPVVHEGATQSGDPDVVIE